MNGLTRWIPWATIATAAIHTLYAFTVLHGAWGDIARAGVFNGIEGDPERESALWFFYAGIGFLALGTFSLREVRATGRLPRSIPLYLLGIGGTMVVVQPASGGWLVLAIGLLSLEARRRDAAAPRAQ